MKAKQTDNVNINLEQEGHDGPGFAQLKIFLKFGLNAYKAKQPSPPGGHVFDQVTWIGGQPRYISLEISHFLGKRFFKCPL